MRKRTSTWSRVCSALIACVFAQYVLAPRHARAWDEGTHQKIVDWAYQIIRLGEYQLDTSPSKPPLTTFTGVSGSLTTPPAGCTGSCLTQWNVFLNKIATARGKLAVLPYGPSEKNKDQHSGNNTCSPSVTAVTIGDYSKLPSGGPPDCNAQTEPYEAGGIFDDPALTVRPNPHLGNTLGFIAASADARTDDWDPEVDVAAALTGLISGILTLGQSTTALDPLVDLVNSGRNVVASLLGVVLALVFFIFTLGLVDSDDVFAAAFDIAHFLTNFDLELFSILPVEANVPEWAVGEGTFVGLGHFMNMQPQVNTVPLMGTWPSNEYDDHQGLFFDEAFFNATPSVPLPQLFQDPMDHKVIDMTGFGVVINPHDSFGVDHYQRGSRERKVAVVGDFVSDDTYWQQHEMHAIPFTPVEKLGDYGWQSFKGDSCKHAESLMWPLHALGDASVPMHVVGTSAHGHRPFEQSMRILVSQWERARNLSLQEFVVDATGVQAQEYTSNTLRTADFQLQFDQARRILDEAFEHSRTIQALGTTDVDVQALITRVAQQTLPLLHSPTTQRLRCDPGACRLVEKQRPAGVCGQNRCPLFGEIHCDGSCTGFLDDPLQPSVVKNPTTNHQHCSQYGDNPNALPKCTVENRVAERLSSESYANVSFPAIMAPALSEEFDSNKGSANSFYAPYVADQRRFAEHAVAGTLAFLVHAADFAGSPSPQACFCGTSGTLCGSGPTASCKDFSQDRENCGACGNVCAPLERCVNGACTTPCSSPWTLCSGTCVDTRFDDQHCGGCSQACQSSSDYCSYGTCRQLR